MVIAGMGVALVPERMAAVPGLMARPIDRPDVVREVELVTVAGREHSPALKTFLRDAMAYSWRA